MCARNIAVFAHGEPTNIDLDTGLPRIDKEGKPMTRQHGPCAERTLRMLAHKCRTMLLQLHPPCWKISGVGRC
jgi:hypothetical protein